MSNSVTQLERPGTGAQGVERVVTRAAEPAVPPPIPKLKRTRSRRPLIFGVVLLLALTLGGWYGFRWWTDGRFMVWTDDAYVGAKTATLAAKVPGYIATLNVEDNASVHAGDIIATIDDGDYKLAVDAARGRIKTQEAAIERMGRQITGNEATVEQMRAQLVSARAGANRAKLELDRQQSLASREFSSKQALEQALANRDQTEAGVASAAAALTAARSARDVSRGQQQEARQTLAELQIALSKAERDLSFTVIRAPFDGVVGNRAIQMGGYVQTGTRMVSLVPLEGVYIDANFKETQLSHIKPGAHVAITIDALPGVAESAVIGLPHPDFGEAVCAVVVKSKSAAGEALVAADIIGELKGRLANFKVPKQVFFATELPRNAMGKVQKNMLRDKHKKA